jgi:lactoylglutathione lyase
MAIVPIRGLYEAHLTVSDLDRSIGFYRDVLGLTLAHRIPERHVAFFWLGAPGQQMLGLWSIHTSPMRLRLHIAFEVELGQVFESVQALRAAGLCLGRVAGRRLRSRSC